MPVFRKVFAEVGADRQTENRWMFRRTDKTAWLTEGLISGAVCQVWQPDRKRREQVREEIQTDGI